MPFEHIQGQAAAVEVLSRMVAGGRIPSALMFLGPHHVGKRTTALALAQALNCAAAPGEGCGSCPPCRQIAEGSHPDVEVIQPDGRFIRIDQVRGVSERLGLIPFGTGRRVIILAQAERMNPPAANAFLKTLEEPPADTLIVLCAESAAQLPETVASRCLPVRFGLLPREVVLDLLGRRGEMTGEQAAFAAGLAQGRLLPGLPEQVERWLALREEALQCLAEGGPGAFPALSEKIARWGGGEDWKFVLGWLETCFRDLALLGEDGDAARLVNADRREALGRLEGRYPVASAAACFDRIQAAREALAVNTNRALTLEALWLGLGAEAAGGRP